MHGHERVGERAKEKDSPALSPGFVLLDVSV